MKGPDEFSLRMKGYSLVTVSVLYYFPDYKSLVNEFVWQTLDLKPKYPRIEQFLEYWQKEIDAIIKEVRLCDSGHTFNPSRYTNVIDLFPRQD